MLTKNAEKRLRMLENAEKGRQDPEFGKQLVANAKETDLLQYGGNLDRLIDQRIKQFGGKLTPTEAADVKEDIWKSRVLNLIDPEEYFWYGFRSLSESERYQFVGNREKESLCSIINENDVSRIFMDKWETYQRFGSYYGREMIRISSGEDKNKFSDFCNRHKKVFVKRSNGSQGKGIFAVDSSTDIDDAWNSVMELIAGGSDAVVEQAIIQGNAMSIFNDSTVNTARIGTFRKHGVTEIVFSFVIFGRKGMVVNNGGMGGIIVSTNVETGICNSDGRDENGITYINHPDSHLKIRGYEIPDWQDAVSLARELSEVVPEQIYVGWDLAYTDTGWIMVEGNSWSQFVGPQIALKVGLRDRIQETFYEYIKDLIK